jgi:hypothetical protein
MALASAPGPGSQLAMNEVRRIFFIAPDLLRSAGKRFPPPAPFSPTSCLCAGTYTNPTTDGSVPATVITTPPSLCATRMEDASLSERPSRLLIFYEQFADPLLQASWAAVTVFRSSEGNDMFCERLKVNTVLSRFDSTRRRVPP